MPVELFRSEAIAYRNRRLLGDLSLAIPPSIRVISWVALSLFALLAAMLIFLEFNERATVFGWVRPSTGIVRVRAPEDCTVEQIFVQEGQMVRAGQPLIRVAIEGKISSEDNFGAASQAALAQQREIGNAIANNDRIGLLKRSEILGQISSNKSKNIQVSNQINIQNSRLKIARSSLDDINKLKDKGFVSKLEVQRRTEAVLLVENDIALLAREAIGLEDQVATLQSQLAQTTAQSEVDSSALRSQSYELTSQAAIRGSRMLTIFASADGVIAALHVQTNETVQKVSPMIAVLPAGGRMQAELFVPASAIGRVKVGQHASILYDAFPFQRYGSDSARVVSISSDVINPSELPTTLPVTKPVYRVIAELAPRKVGINDKFALRPAMSFRADIILARKPAWQLIIKPVQAVTRR